MKYKVGDIVRIREDLKEGRDYFIYCASEMTTFKGKSCVIFKAYNFGYDVYILKDCISNEIIGDGHANGGEGWRWTNDMLVKYVPFIDFLREVGNV